MGKLETGLHDNVSMERYLGDLCPGPSISGSGLHKIDSRCPAVFWSDSYLNPDREPENKTPAKELGKAVHTLILEGMDAFNAAHVIKPQGIDYRTKDGKAWRDAQTRAIVDADDWVMIRRMWNAVMADPMAARVFTDGKPEQTLVWQDQATGVWLKSRPDWLPNKLTVIPNYKTAISAKPSEWSKQASQLGYHQSAALLIDGIKAVLGKDAPVESWEDEDGMMMSRFANTAPVPYWVVQEKTPPYVVELFTMTPEAIEWGRLQNRRAIDLFARCLETKTWPKYTDKVTEIGLPAWAERTLEKRHEAGDFAEAEPAGEFPGAPLETGLMA